MTTTLPDKYPYPEYEAAHRSTFNRPARQPIRKVLPPGVSEEDFGQAIKDFVAVVGEASVFIDEGLSDYVDPYDINESNEKRKTPSAAVW